MLAGLADPVDLVGDRLQPGPAIFVGQGMAGAHLGDIAGGMKPVAVLVASSPAARPVLPRWCSCPSRTRPSRSARRAVVPVSSATKILRQRGLDRPARWSRRWNARGSPAGSRLRARASRSRACSRPRPRTAFRGRRRAPARSASPAARTARHGPWARRPPSARSLERRDNRETARRYGRRGRRPSAPDRTAAWPGLEPVGAIERFQLALVAPRGLVGIGGIGRDRMDVGGRRASDRERSAAPSPCC